MSENDFKLQYIYRNKKKLFINAGKLAQTAVAAA